MAGVHAASARPALAARPPPKPPSHLLREGSAPHGSLGAALSRATQRVRHPRWLRPSARGVGSIATSAIVVLCSSTATRARRRRRFPSRAPRSRGPTRAAVDVAVEAPPVNAEPLAAIEEGGGSSVEGEPRSPPPSEEDERGLMVGLVAAAYVIWTMDKVNMAVAVLPMQVEYNWDPAAVGIIQSALFWGYAATQVLGGFLATRFGGKRVLLGAVVLWSTMTALAPLAASVSTQVFIASRVLVGIGEGLAPAAGIRIVASWVPEEERSRAVATLGGGKNAGSIAGLLVAPLVINAFGWPAMFYSFGVLGLVWGCVWFVLGKDREEALPVSAEGTRAASPTEGEEEAPIPWMEILTCVPLWATVVAHFCYDWGMYALLTWTPSYLNQGLGYDLQGSSLITIVPSVLAVATAVVAGTTADRLVAEGMDLTLVRKAMQTVGFAVPALCLSLLGFIGVGTFGDVPSLVPIALLTIGIGGGSFSLAGLYSSHADLNAKYSGLVNGISTTFGALSGVGSNAYAGYALASTGSWTQAIFLPSVLFYFVGWVTYVSLYNATPLDWDADAARAAEEEEEAAGKR